MLLTDEMHSRIWDWVNIELMFQPHCQDRREEEEAKEEERRRHDEDDEW